VQNAEVAKAVGYSNKTNLTKATSVGYSNSTGVNVGSGANRRSSDLTAFFLFFKKYAFSGIFRSKFLLKNVLNS